MATTRGCFGKVYSGTNPDRVREVRNWSFEETAAVIDTSEMGDCTKKFETGAVQATGQIQTWWDATDAGQENFIVGDKIDIELRPRGDVIGGRVYLANVTVTNVGVTQDRDGVTEQTFQWQANGSMVRASHPYIAIAVSGAPLGTSAGFVGTPLSLDFTGSFTAGEAPYSFAVAGLPAGTGLSIDSVSGVLAGTPLAADGVGSPISVQVTATDAAGRTAVHTVALTIPYTLIAISGTPLGAQVGSVGVAFSADFSGSFQDGQTPYVYSLETSLPSGTGLTFNGATGELAGTPVAADNAASPFTATVKATDAGGGSVSHSAQITINP